MALYNMVGPGDDAKKDKLEKQKQLVVDAQTLSFDEWKKKYSALSAAEKRVLQINDSMIADRGSFKSFQDTNVSFFDTQLSNLDKKLGLEKAAAEKAAALKAQQEKEDQELTAAATPISNFFKQTSADAKTINQLSGVAKEKYGFDPNDKATPNEIIARGMVSEANQRIQSKEGIPLWYDVKNENTCINGVCTIAANQGVDFSSLKGRDPNTLKNTKGQYIPVQNASFLANLESSGYEPIPAGEFPKPGDFAQYFKAEGNMGELRPHHAEIVLNSKDAQGGVNLETFNNYQLTNTGEGLSKRSVSKTPQGGFTEGGWDDVRFYRLKPEVAEKALQKNPGYIKSQQGKSQYMASPEFKQLQETQGRLATADINILGQDKDLYQDIVTGITNNEDKEKLKTKLLPKSKNPKLIARVIDQVYTQN